MATIMTKKEEDMLRRFWESDSFISIDTGYGNSIWVENAVRHTKYYTWDEFVKLCSPDGLELDEDGYEVEWLSGED